MTQISLLHFQLTHEKAWKTEIEGNQYHFLNIYVTLTIRNMNVLQMIKIKAKII